MQKFAAGLVFWLINDPAVLKTKFKFVLGPPIPGGPGGGSGRPFPSGDHVFWADSSPDPGGNIFFILMLALSTARIIDGAVVKCVVWPRGMAG